MNLLSLGVTPFASILKHIWYRQKKGRLGSLRRVEFFWICRDAPSFGWFQNLLQGIEQAQADRKSFSFLPVRGYLISHFTWTANFLRFNIYLTQKVEEDMLWNIAVNDAGASFDPLTLLRTHTTFGRPDWMSVYGKMKQAIEIGQYIPGSKSQLKTKVAVRNTITWIRVLYWYLCLDIFLWSHQPGESYQKGLRPSHRRRDWIHIYQGLSLFITQFLLLITIQTRNTSDLYLSEFLMIYYLRSGVLAVLDELLTISK